MRNANHIFVKACLSTQPEKDLDFLGNLVNVSGKVSEGSQVCGVNAV